jgi:enoyl-CoA hydratase/carnithine racemase
MNPATGRLTHGETYRRHDGGPTHRDALPSLPVPNSDSRSQPSVDAAEGGGDVLYESSEGIARLTINRPNRRNAMSWEVMRGLREGLARAKKDSGVRVVVLQGAGPDAFCSGADLGGMVGEEEGFLALHESRGTLPSLFDDLWTLGKPTMARVQGWALAGGFGLALACDLVVASERARFGAPEINVGLWPHMITVPLVRSMPPKKALELMLTGRIVDAAEAERLGFVNRVVPHDSLDATVDELATTLASKSLAVMKLGRDGFYAVWDMEARDALAHLHALLSLNSQTQDAAEGVAAFLEKRPPNWSGR